MRARVPMDVDLEDRLVFGLTPQRLGYVAMSGLVAITIWHAIPVVGGAVGLLPVAIGVAFGWGQWRGRGLDHWVVAGSAWLVRNRRLQVDRRLVESLRLRVPRAPWHRRRPRFRTQLPPVAKRLQVLGDGDFEE